MMNNGRVYITWSVITYFLPVDPDAGIIIYINDLPMNVKSKVRLYADDTALYLTISTSSQSELPQKDLHDNLERWSHTWDMKLVHL